MAHHPRNTHSILSSELGWILITIRSLTSDTTTDEIFRADKQKAGLELQQQLEVLDLRTGIKCLKKACILGSSIYIDFVILRRTYDRIALIEAKRRLQEAMIQSRNCQDKESRDILLWISAMADIMLSLRSRELQDALVDDFRMMVARLESLYVDAV